MVPEVRPPAGGDAVLEVRLLGPVQVIRGGREIALRGWQQRAVLALLVAEAGRVIQADRLVEDLWRGSPPPGAGTTLRSVVSRLRGVLGAEAPLVARGGGYVITVRPDRVDACRFEELVAAGRAALGGGDLRAAAARFADALGLWRGPALAGTGEVERLAREAARLEELRLVAVEGRVEAEVDLGRPGEVVGELERLVAEYPLRERLWRLLVLALYRAQRQGDALAAYRRARALLADELGLEPGEELRALQGAVLRQEVPSAPAAARCNLPAPVTSFVGREEETAELARLVGAARLVTLTGPGGVGKTRLAVEVAAGALPRFADGVWLADLAGISDGGLVGAAVMQALGVRQEGGVTAAEALRFRLLTAELLLVLDNCEHLLDSCVRLATVLLQGAPGLRVLATSREALGLPGEVAYPVRPLPLPPEAPGDRADAEAAAVRLFLDRGQAARGGRPIPADAVTAGRICRKLDGLPLAIELAAARLGTMSAADVEAQLADRFAFLAYRRPVPDPRHQALQAAMDWSYDLLTAAERELFEELSVFAGSFEVGQVAAICTSGDQAAALALIDGLAAKSLVMCEQGKEFTRYRMLETVRQYAAARLAKAGDPEDARRRHALAYLHLARSHRDPLELAPELDNFRAALEWSLSGGDESGPRLAAALGDFWLARGLLQEGRDWLERSLDQPMADQRLRAELLRQLGTIACEISNFPHAEAILSDGAEAAETVGATAVRARIQVLLAEIRVARGESIASALADCQAATAVLEADGDLAGLAEAWYVTGHLLSGMDRPAEQGLDAYERAIAFARQSGHRHIAARASLYLGILLQNSTVPADEYIARFEDLLRDAQGDQWTEAHLRLMLSAMYPMVGRFTDARAALKHGRALLTAFGARYYLALTAVPAGAIEMAASDYGAAERCSREGYEELRAIGERGYRSMIASVIAEALYAQSRFDEAQQMSEEAEEAAPSDDLEPQLDWKIVRAKLVAQDGQVPAARRLITQVEAAMPPSPWPVVEARIQIAKAEISRLARQPDQAERHLRAALGTYEDIRATALAEQVKTSIADLNRREPRMPATGKR